MDATTPRRDDEPTPAQPDGPPPLVEPAQPPRAGGSSPLGTPARDDGPEDPTVPDTAVEARLSSEPAGGSPDEPVLAASSPEKVQAPAEPAANAAASDAPPRSEQPAEPASQPAASAAEGSVPKPARWDQPAASEPPVAPGSDVVYVAAPTPPKKKGNRGIGVLLAALSTILFLAVYVAVVVVINSVQGRGTGMEFLSILEFYIPVVLFAIGFVLLAVIVNRAGWWSFVLGSFFVGAFVYLGYVGLLLLSEASTLTPEAALVSFRSLLISPITVAAGLVAREVALWVGAAISARGRRVKARNAEARAQFDREQAEHRAEIERTGAVVRPA